MKIKTLFVLLVAFGISPLALSKNTAGHCTNLSKECNIPLCKNVTTTADELVPVGAKEFSSFCLILSEI